MIDNSKTYRNRRGATVVLASNRVDNTPHSNRLHDAIAIIGLVALCIASSIVNVA